MPDTLAEHTGLPQPTRACSHTLLLTTPSTRSWAPSCPKLDNAVRALVPSEGDALTTATPHTAQKLSLIGNTLHPVGARLFITPMPSSTAQRPSPRTPAQTTSQTQLAHSKRYAPKWPAHKPNAPTPGYRGSCPIPKPAAHCSGMTHSAVQQLQHACVVAVAVRASMVHPVIRSQSHLPAILAQH